MKAASSQTPRFATQASGRSLHSGRAAQIASVASQPPWRRAQAPLLAHTGARSQSASLTATQRPPRAPQKPDSRQTAEARQPSSLSATQRPPLATHSPLIAQGLYRSEPTGSAHWASVVAPRSQSPPTGVQAPNIEQARDAAQSCGVRATQAPETTEQRPDSAHQSMRSAPRALQSAGVAATGLQKPPIARQAPRSVQSSEARQCASSAATHSGPDVVHRP